MKNKFYKGLLLLICLVTMLSCAKKVGVVEIAVAGAHSGDLAGYGIPSLRAAELVFGDSKDIQITALDDLCDAGVAVNVASNVISSSAVAVLGHICSGATKAALGLYKEVGITSISPSASETSLTKSGDYKSVFFRTMAPNDLQGIVQANYIARKLDAKNVGIIHDNGEYGKSLAQNTKEELEAKGVNIVFFEGIAVGAVDYSTIVNKVASAGVDALVFGGFQPEASKLLSQMQRRGVEVPFIGGDGIKAVDFIKLAGSGAEGVLATGTKDYSDNDIYQEAVKKHIDKYSEEPGTFFEQAYSAALVLKQIIGTLKKNGTEITRKSVNEYINDTSKTYDTPLGKISFDKNGDTIGGGYVVYMVQNGKYVEVK